MANSLRTDAETGPPKGIDVTVDVLLIEDNPKDARLIDEYFEEMRRERLFEQHWDLSGSMEVSITHTETLADGIDRLAEDAFDVILLDLHLPDGRGVELISDLEAAEPQAPIVVLTGMPEQVMGLEAISRGAQDYLVKQNITPRLLLKTIQFAIERRETRRKLTRQSEQLTILNRLTRHDIRNDVSLIVGRAQELRSLVDAQGRDRLEQIINSGNHVLQLTESIGDALEAITHTEAGGELDAVALRPLLEEEVRKAQERYNDAEIRLGDVPDVHVQGNRLLSSMIANLLNNGVIYNDKDEAYVGIDVEAGPDDVRISIADNGPGIPRQTRENLFTDDIVGTETAGLGIGLTLVYRLVRTFDGEIDFEENEPTGTVFTVELPRTEP